MYAELRPVSAEEFERIAELLWQVGDCAISAQESVRLTEEISRLWAISDPGLYAVHVANSSIYDAVNQQRPTQ
jgi:hypothetical protein